MFRLIPPADQQELPLRMLFHPVSDGLFFAPVKRTAFADLSPLCWTTPAMSTSSRGRGWDFASAWQTT